jgi:FixJ family two-component response regulator
LGTQDVIAIIDDDVLVRESIRRLTNSLGFLTEIFSSAEEFMTSGVVSLTWCIIADVNMPGSSARELPSTLRARGCDVPIIFMTALPNRDLRAQLLDKGAICVLQKPFSQKDMLACIAKALEPAGTPATSDSRAR